MRVVRKEVITDHWTLLIQPYNSIKAPKIKRHKPNLRVMLSRNSC